MEILIHSQLGAQTEYIDMHKHIGMHAYIYLVIYLSFATQNIKVCLKVISYIISIFGLNVFK